MTHYPAERHPERVRQQLIFLVGLILVLMTVHVNVYRQITKKVMFRHISRKQFFLSYYIFTIWPKDGTDLTISVVFSVQLGVFSNNKKEIILVY